MSDKQKILFLCTGNSCRSQMAEGWTRKLLSEYLEPSSAGIESHGVNPVAVAVMKEAGVDISHHRSQLLDEFDLTDFDWVVTVCDHAHESCPLVPKGCRVIHHSFDDPPRLAVKAATKEARLECYRRVRDEIRTFIETLPQRLQARNDEQ